MPLHPEARAALEALNDPNAPPITELSSLTPEQAREALTEVPWLADLAVEPVAKIEVFTTEGRERSIPVRVFTPEGSGPFGVLVYFHGGGWVIGDLELYDPMSRILANASSCVVVCVDYGLAPENKFPVGLEDCYAATCWTLENAAMLNIDPARLAVGGDSSGGNLAAAVCLMARDKGGPAIRFQLLVYPCTNCLFDSPSCFEFREGYFLTLDSMQWFRGHYLRDENDRLHPYASPLLVPDLSSLPPALVITAEYDPLRDEGEAYAVRLQEAGNEVVSVRYLGQLHGFSVPAFTAGRQALAMQGMTLRAALA